MEANELLKNAMNDLKRTVREICNDIKETVNEAIEVRKEIKKTISLRETWHIPIKIDMPKSPHVKTPNIPRIRSDL